MKRDLTDYFLDKVNTTEVLDVFFSYFGNAGQISDSKIEFRSHDGNSKLVLEYNINGAIIGIEDNLGRSEFKQLNNRIKDELVDNQTEKIGRIICFSHDRIRGVFKYNELFQITPIPEGNPVVDYAVADHPFVLEVKYLNCTNTNINFSRRIEKAVQYIRYLNILSRSRIFNSPKNVNHFWGLTKSGKGSYSSEWIQSTYAPSTGIGDVEFFTSNERLIDLINSNEYYGNGYYRSTSDFVFPDNIVSTLDKIFSLSGENKIKFERACAWFYQSQLVAQNSSSMAYISIVCALESLLTSKKDTCGCCGQPKFSVNRNFKNFLNFYIPNIRKLKKETDLIYNVRSKMVHGGFPLICDLEHWRFGLDYKKDNQDRLHRITYQVSLTAILNWLNNPS